MIPLLQSTASQHVPIRLFNNAGNPVTGVLAPTITASKNGGAYAAASDGTWTELGSGTYDIRLDGTDSNTVGYLIVRVTGAGFVDQPVLCWVRANTEKQVFDRIGAPVLADISTDISAVKADSAAILVDTAEMQPKLPTNNIMGSSVKSDKDDDIDAILVDTNETQGKLPTNNIMGSSVKSDKDDDIDTILADTNETQGKLPTNNIMGSSDKADHDDEINDILTDTADMQPRVVAIESDTSEMQPKLPTNNIMGSSVKTDKDDEIDQINTRVDQSLSATESAIRGADSDDLKDLSDQLDAVQNSVDGISNVTRLSAAIPKYMERPASGDKAVVVKVALKDNDGNMEDPDSNDLAIKVYNSAGTSKNANLYKEQALTNALDNSGYSGYKKLVRTGIGLYELYYKVNSAETEEELVFEFYWEETSVGLIEFRSTQITDSANDLSAVKAKTDKLTFDGDNMVLADARKISQSQTAADNVEANIPNLDEAITVAESNIRGADSDDLKDISDQIDSLNDLSAADVKAEVDTALSDIELDHLMKLAASGANVTDDSALAQLVSKLATADWDSYDNTSDSLEALRDALAASGITSQQVRDAMKLAPSVGAPAAGSVDLHLDDIDADTAEMQLKLPTNNIMGSSVKTDKDDEIDSIKAKTDVLTFSGANVQSRVADKGVLNDISAAQAADAVWDELTAGHVIAGSFGKLSADQWAALLRIPKKLARILYVDKFSGLDTNDGLTPATAYQTLGKALLVVGQGETIRAKGYWNSPYQEANLQLGVYGVTLEGDPDVTIKNSVSGNPALLVSYDGCIVRNIKFQGNNGPGLRVYACNYCTFENLLSSVVGAYPAYQIDAANGLYKDCDAFAYGAGAIGWQVSSTQNIFVRCSAKGWSTLAARGFYIYGGTALLNTFIDCFSRTCTTACIDIGAGPANNLFIRFSKGPLDGSKADLGTNTKFIDFGEGSQIVTSQSREKDLKDIFDSVALRSTSVQLAASEAAIRGADNDDLKDISDQLDAVPGSTWDTARSGHTTPNTFGETVDSLDGKLPSGDIASPGDEMALTPAAVDAVSELRCQRALAFDATADTLTINAWLEREGRTVSSPTSAEITVLDDAGTQVFAPLTSSSHVGGVFRLTKSAPGLVGSKTYRVKVKITYNAVDYENVGNVVTVGS